MHFPRIGLAALIVIGLATPALAKQHTVKMNGMKFVPASVTVAKGDTIVWVNTDKARQPHNVMARNKAFKSKMLMQPGETFTWKAVKAGAIPYTCSIHPGMDAIVVVK